MLNSYKRSGEVLSDRKAKPTGAKGVGFGPGSKQSPPGSVGRTAFLPVDVWPICRLVVNSDPESSDYHCWPVAMAQRMQNVGQKAVFQLKGIRNAHKDANRISCARWHRGIHGRLTRCDPACSSTDSVSKSQQEPSAKRRRHQDEKDRHLLENDSSIALGLEVLPEDVVSHIFSYLPFYEVLSLAQVSKTWLQASQNPHAFINVDLSWVDNSPQQAPGECIDLLGESYTLPLKRSGKLVEYLQPRASALTIIMSRACRSKQYT
jgi:hypothetical protein